MKQVPLLLTEHRTGNVQDVSKVPCHLFFFSLTNFVNFKSKGKFKRDSFLIMFRKLFLSNVD